jgi:hypothetical protein
VNGLHWISREVGGSKGGYDMCLENIFISHSFKILFSVRVVYHHRISYITKTLH